MRARLWERRTRGVGTRYGQGGVHQCRGSFPGKFTIHQSIFCSRHQPCKRQASFQADARHATDHAPSRPSAARRSRTPWLFSMEHTATCSPLPGNGMEGPLNTSENPSQIEHLASHQSQHTTPQQRLPHQLTLGQGASCFHRPGRHTRAHSFPGQPGLFPGARPFLARWRGREG